MYIVRDPDHAGYRGGNLSARSRGVIAGPAEPHGSAGLKAVALDPDGNSIAIIHVTGSR